MEDLLRVKRAEQPPPEFWDEFQRGMRAKQLAAIVEPRPWWAPFIKVGARVARYQLPVGAAAILAVTFVMVSEYRTVERAPVFEPAVATVASSPLAAESARESAVPAASAPMSITESATTVAATNPAPSAPVTVPESTSVGTVSHVVPVEVSPSARYIAENLAAAQAADPELDQMLSRSLRGIESRPVREPLAQVNVPGESRRSRLLGGNAWLASATVNGDSALRTDDHAARRLTERRLSESDVVSRIDVGGDRVSYRF
ncbi:MAG: hypothetical protein JSR48_00905 [Verrucomicrobia bacterium]|nr:hypothetical protein [Verrucomicrobiota bacterium]